MTTATKLTVSRLLLLGPILLLLSCGLRNGALLAMLVFWGALATDWLDGAIARRRGQVTEFGGFLDPLFDKILIYTLVFYFSALGVYSLTLAALALSRDLVVEVMRCFSAIKKQKALPANRWGKLKFVLQALSVNSGFFALLLPRDIHLALTAIANFLLATALIVSLPGVWILWRALSVETLMPGSPQKVPTLDVGGLPNPAPAADSHGRR
jgi:CDP-diacylglycerol--glycerol-3-phosphate 3-phosphatidyltransferase